MKKHQVVNIFRKGNSLTKKPQLELYPIIKIIEYAHGKETGKSYWCIRTSNGDEHYFKSYKDAEAFQLKNKIT